jgi:hypothetical protein
MFAPALHEVSGQAVAEAISLASRHVSKAPEVGVEQREQAVEGRIIAAVRSRGE